VAAADGGWRRRTRAPESPCEDSNSGVARLIWRQAQIKESCSQATMLVNVELAIDNLK
jgi:hypothetical protein